MALSKGKKIALGIGAVGGITGIALVVASKVKAGPTPTPTPPPPGLANLYGKVTNASSGSPVAGALITLDSIIISTDSNGNYTINDITPGSYTFAVQKTGYNTFTQDVNIAEGSHQGNIQLVPVATPPPTADIKVEGLIISPSQVNVGDKVVISVTATNYGAADGSKPISLSADGLTGSRDVTLSTGQSQQVIFEIIPQTAKTYNVSVDGLTGSFIASTPIVGVDLQLAGNLVVVHSMDHILFSEFGTIRHSVDTGVWDYVPGVILGNDARYDIMLPKAKLVVPRKVSAVSGESIQWSFRATDIWAGYGTTITFYLEYSSDGGQSAGPPQYSTSKEVPTSKNYWAPFDMDVNINGLSFPGSLGKGKYWAYIQMHGAEGNFGFYFLVEGIEVV